jgi:hypothetical protein
MEFSRGGNAQEQWRSDVWWGLGSFCSLPLSYTRVTRILRGFYCARQIFKVTRAPGISAKARRSSEIDRCRAGRRSVNQAWRAIRKSRKIVCVGLNYRQHAKETGIQPPRVPPLFSKFNNSLAAQNAAIELPCHCRLRKGQARVVESGRRDRQLNRKTRQAEVQFGVGEVRKSRPTRWATFSFATD